LHYTHIGAIERGKKNWSTDTLIKVAKGLNVEIVDLFILSLPATDLNNLKKSLIEGIYTSSPQTIRILVDILKGFKSLEVQQSKQKQKRKF
jgi:DNA-binding XRE family transcriptional regulator